MMMMMMTMMMKMTFFNDFKVYENPHLFNSFKSNKNNTSASMLGL